VEEVADVIRKRDYSRALELLREIHREKAFSMAEAEYGEFDVDKMAKYHAVHIALMSVVYDQEFDVDGESLTGIDYILSRAFTNSLKECREINININNFYNNVISYLNKLLRDLCTTF